MDTLRVSEVLHGPWGPELSSQKCEFCLQELIMDGGRIPVVQCTRSNASSLVGGQDSLLGVIS